MRIAVLMRRDGLNAIDQVSELLSQQLQHTGHDATLLSWSDAGSTPDADFYVIPYNPYMYGRYGFAPRLVWRALRARVGGSRVVLYVHEAFVPMRDGKTILAGLWQRAQLAALLLIASQRFATTQPFAEDLSRFGPTVLYLPSGPTLPDRRAQRHDTRSALFASLVAEFASSTAKEDLHEPEALAEDVGDRSPSNLRAGVLVAEFASSTVKEDQHEPEALAEDVGDRSPSNVRAGVPALTCSDALVVATVSTGHPAHDSALVSAALRRLVGAGRPIVFLQLGAHANAVDVPDGVTTYCPGYLSDDDLARAVASADLVLLPLIDGISSRRSSMHAAFQHRIATVGTIGSSTDPLLADAGLRLVRAGDADAFAALAADLADDAVERDRIAQIGHDVYERYYAWDRITERFLRGLADLVGPAALGTTTEHRQRDDS